MIRFLQLRTLLIALAAIIAIAVGLVCLYVWYAPFTAFLDGVRLAATVPSDLKHVTFISVEEGASARYRIEGGRFMKQEQDVPEAERGIALSPDGTKQVYAKILASQRTGLDATVDIGNHEVMIVRDGATETLARGYRPTFMDNDHLIYFVPGGIVSHDLTNSSASLLMRAPEGKWLGNYVAYAPSNSLVLWRNALSNQYVLGRVSTTAYDTINTFNGLSAPALTDEGVYDVRVTAEGTEVWKYGLDDSTFTLVTVIPETLHVTALLP